MNSTSTIEIATSMSRIEHFINQDKTQTTYSSSTYGTVTHFSNNRICITGSPGQFTSAYSTQTKESAASKLILLNIEEEFRIITKAKA